MSVKFLLRMNQKMGHLIEHGGYGQQPGLGGSPVEAYDDWVIDYESKLGG